MDFKYLLFLILSLSVVILFLKLYRNRYFHPVFLGVVFWVALVLISITGSYSFNFTFYWSGIFPIYACLLFYSIGGTLIDKVFKEKNTSGSKNQADYYADILEKRFVIASSLIFIFGVYKMVIGNNLNYNSSISEIANSISKLRYSDGLHIPTITKIGTVLNFCAVYFAAKILVIRNNIKELIIGVLPIIAGFLNSIITASRAGLLMMLCIYVASYIANYLFYNNKPIKINFKIVFRLGVILILIVGYFLSIQLIRGKKGLSDALPILKHLSVYFFGFYNGFSIWWENYNVGFFEHTWGKYTFSGILDLFFNSRETGLFTNPIELAPGYETNIYTIFRVLIQDFSLLISWVLAFVGGVVSTIAYYMVINKHRAGVLLLVFFYAVLFWSHTTYIFIYNTILVGYILSILIESRRSFRLCVKI